MFYEKIVLEHFNNPHNVGSFPMGTKNVSVAFISEPGVVLKFAVQVEGDIIVDTKIKVYGNGAAIAAMSLLSEKVKGMNIKDALNIKSTWIDETLKLTPVKIYFSILAVDCLQKAILKHEQL